MTPNDELDADDDAYEQGVDDETELILDYLSNKLDPQDAAALESRARVDKDFRYKLADVVLLKGLVMLALDKNPGPEARECRKSQRLFVDYLKGRTSAAKTAQLSRHLDECFECELAFERFESREGEKADRGGWGGFWQRFELPGRRLLVAGLAAGALAAGAFGVVGLLTSAAGPRSEARPVAPGGHARPDSAVTSVAELRAEFAVLRSRDPELAGSMRFAEIEGEIVDDARTPDERADLYKGLGVAFGARIQSLLWVAARNEPASSARDCAYHALLKLGVENLDRRELLRAIRREIASRTRSVFLLLGAVAKTMDDEMRAELRALFEPDVAADPIWRAQVLRKTYRAMNDDPIAVARLRASLRSPLERVRAYAVEASLACDETVGLPAAIELLGAADDEARAVAAIALTRHGPASAFEHVVEIDWSSLPAVATEVTKRARKDGITIPHVP